MGRGYGKVRAYFNVFPQARSKFAYFLVGKSVEHNQISYMDTECSDLDLFEPMKLYKFPILFLSLQVI